MNLTSLAIGAKRKALSLAQSELRVAPYGRLVLGFVYSGLATLTLGKRVSVREAQGIWVHRSGDGSIHVDIEPTRRPVSLSNSQMTLFTHAYEPRPGDVVVDLGAGVGTELPSFAEQVGNQGRVIAIEANPKIAACAKQLVKLRNLEVVEVVAVAVSASPGSATIETERKSHLGTRVEDDEPGHRPDPALTRVEAVTLTNLFESLGVVNVDYMKINIEGHEYKALQGLDCSRVVVRNLCVSCHDFLKNESTSTYQDVFAWMSDHGYRVERHPPVSGQPWAEYYLYGSIE